TRSYGDWSSDVCSSDLGLLGVGTVGSGTVKVLTRNQEEIRRRAGRGIEIAMVADIDPTRAHGLVGDGVQVVADGRAVIANPAIRSEERRVGEEWRRRAC